MNTWFVYLIDDSPVLVHRFLRAFFPLSHHRVLTTELLDFLGQGVIFVILANCFVGFGGFFFFFYFFYLYFSISPFDLGSNVNDLTFALSL